MRIIEVREDGSLVVSGRGLRRIISQPGNRILREPETIDSANRFIAAYNSCFPNGDRWAEAITYREVYRRSRRQRAAN